MPAPKKKTTKKTTAKRGKAKVSPKKVVVKKVAKKTNKKVAQKRSSKSSKITTKKANKNIKTTRKLKTDKKETVSLPSSAGPRLQEKVVATHKLMEMLERPMYRIAYVSAFSFILVAAFGLLLPFAGSFINQVATVCVTDECVDEQTLKTGDLEDTTSVTQLSNEDDVISQTYQTVEPPILEYFDEIPSTLSNEQQFSLRVINTQKLRVLAVSLETGKEYSIDTNRLSIENYRYILDPNKFTIGEYKVKTELENEGLFTVASLGFFRIVDDNASVTDTETQTTSTIGSETNFDSSVETESEQQQSDSDEIELINNLQNDSTDEVSNDLITDDQEVTSDVSTEDSTEEETSSVPEVPEVTEKKFIFKQFASTWQADEVVRVETPVGYYSVQLYIRPQSGLNARFLGTMFKREDVWLYLFDSVNIPNGDYELFATAQSNTGLKYSDSKIIKVANERLATKIATTTESTTLQTYTPTTSLRNFYEVEDTTLESEDNSEIIESINQIIINNLESINDLMKRYAVAKQSDNDVLIKTVDNEISKKELELLRELADSPESRDTVSQMDVELANRITQIKQRVDAFEMVRRSRLNDTVSIDTDGDGISDFDERNVYNTDPESADSDGDGFNDGAEVARGYDPTDATAEEIVRYELPTEVVGLERSDVLTIAQVNPVVTKEEDDDDRVFAEIVGQGLPNSFVTLYIFSSPIIVTVKTDADGSFVYRFDKELEDGEHEVYVAFTDNRGSILAHSEPFQFVKQAEAFSPVGAETEGQAFTAPSIVETSSISVTRVVLSLTVLVLGFFLLMLGINIRETSPKMKLAENES